MATINEIKNRATTQAREESGQDAPRSRQRFPPERDRTAQNRPLPPPVQVDDEDEIDEQPAGPRKPGFLRRALDFDFSINKENAPKILPFVFYVSFWLVMYIANHQYGEKALVRADRMRKEMKDLKADFYTLNAALSNKSIQSHVAKMVEPLGLKELTTPPGRIRIKNEDNAR